MTRRWRPPEITTVFDALRVGLDEDTDLQAADMRRLADAIEEGVGRDRLRADHFIHLRCEVAVGRRAGGFACSRRTSGSASPR